MSGSDYKQVKTITSKIVNNQQHHDNEHEARSPSDYIAALAGLDVAYAGSIKYNLERLSFSGT